MAPFLSLIRGLHMLRVELDSNSKLRMELDWSELYLCSLPEYMQTSTQDDEFWVNVNFNIRQVENKHMIALMNTFEGT